MSDLAAGGSGPESDAGAVATAEAPGSRGGEPLGPGTGHTGVNVALWAGVPVVTVQGLDGGPGGDTSMLEPPEQVPDLRVQLDACSRPAGSAILPPGSTDSVVRGLVQAVGMEDLGFRFMPDIRGRRSFPILLRETDQHVPRLEDPDPEELFGQETHIDLPWDQGELTVTFTPLASRRGSSTDFGP